MKGMGATLQDIFSSATLDASLEAAFLLKPTGILVAGWTRSDVPHDVISVMAATMWGSLDTITRTLGGASARSVMVEADPVRIHALQVPPNWTLLLVGPLSMGRRRLHREALRILDLLPPLRRENGARRLAVEYPR